MNHKAQGTIEYLVIIAIVVVIALVVVGLLLQILGNFGSMSETSLKTAWKSAEPWAITDWSNAAGTMKLVLKNNTAETLTLTNVVVGTSDTSFTPSATVPPGATAVAETTVTCTAGNKYAVSKADVAITYNTTSITGKVQSGVADIAGTC